MVFPKRSHNMIFLVLSGKMIFLFNENVILFFRQKRKFDLSQEKKKKRKFMEIWCFLQMFLKYGLSRKIALECIFFAMSEKMVFPENMRFFFRRKMKDDLSQKTHGNMIFSVYMCKCYKYDITLLSKKAKIIFSRI